MQYTSQSFAEIVAQTLSAQHTVYEREKRVKSLYHVPRGCRQRDTFPHHVRHTYPIKDGITARDLMAENIMQHNALFRRLVG